MRYSKNSIVLILTTVVIALALSLNFAKYFPFMSNQETSLEKQPAKKYMILVDVEVHRLYLFENGVCIKQYLASTGKYDTPSPLGFFKIVHKDTWGEGFGGRWLGLNVPWGQYGIHGTIFPDSIGGDTSHGCIRLWNKDVKELYEIVPIGTRVLIVNGPYGPYGQRLRTLYLDDYGSDVMAVQKRLKELGFYRYNADGVLGAATIYSLNKFQQSKKIPVRDIIGQAEYDALGIIAAE